MKQDLQYQQNTETNIRQEGRASRGALLWQLFASFFKIGLFTIGGGLAMIPLLERIAVKDKKWFTEEEMMDCLAVSQSLPGVVAVNMATYVGKRKYVTGAFTGIKAGVCGMILATVIRLGRKNLQDAFGWIIALAAFILIAFLGVSAVWVILGAALCGVLWVMAVGKRSAGRPADHDRGGGPEDREQYDDQEGGA